MSAALRDVTELARRGRHAEALALCERITAARPDALDAWLLSARLHLQGGCFEAMGAALQQVLRRRSGHREARLLQIEQRIYCGDVRSALAQLACLEQEAGGDAVLWQQIAEYYTHCAAHADALRCCERAAALAPDARTVLYNLGAAQIAMGAFADAEHTLDTLLVRYPRDFDAYVNRSSLRRQTRADNHIDALQVLLTQFGDSAAVVPLNYALGKEYEDLDDYAAAFAYYQRGASRRRARLQYRVEGDEVAIARIIAVFDRRLLARRRPAAEPGPIFVLGLPRSGTTLVERILSSHSAVGSLGEIHDFAFSLLRALGRGGDKLSLIERSATLDFARLGDIYRRALAGYGRGEIYLIDKTPLNFLYLGLIHLALPGARVIHVRRHPLDSCLAMYKTLFRAGYPFSYDFDDLARYYIAYHRLLQHWRSHIPESFIDVDYETLVAGQEPTTRRLLDYCGLAWEPGCLNFHHNPAPTATASARQVRQPLYRDAAGRWHHYAQQLEPLAAQLRAAGIVVPD